jgi:hypothetical protein
MKPFAVLAAAVLAGTTLVVSMELIDAADAGVAEVSLVTIGERAEMLALIAGTSLEEQLPAVLTEAHQRNGDPLDGVEVDGPVVRLRTVTGQCFEMTVGAPFEPRPVTSCP